MSDSHNPPKLSKKQVLLALLARGTAHVALDPRPREVEVPRHLKDKCSTTFDLSYFFDAKPIHDLNVTDHGFSGTLSFRGLYYLCVVPWSAVYAILNDDKRGMIWPEDAPPEVKEEAGITKKEPADTEPAPADEDDTKTKIVSIDAFRKRRS